MAANLTPEQAKQQQELLKDQELAQQRIEERNKRMAVAGQEEIKRLRKRNEEDKKHLESLNEQLGVIKDIQDEADDYVKFWSQAAERQDEYQDLLEEFQTDISKLNKDVVKTLTSSNKNSNQFAAITARILELKKQQINASDEEREKLQASEKTLMSIRKAQIDNAEGLVNEIQSVVGISDAAKRRMEFETSIVHLSEEDKKLAYETFLINQKLLAQQERYVELKKQTRDIVQELPEGIQKIVTGIGDMVSGIMNGLGPLVIMGAIAAAAVKHFAEMQEAGKKFRQDTGLLKTQTAELDEELKHVVEKYAQLGVNAESFYDAQKALTNEFGDTVKFSEGLRSSIVLMNKQLGIAEKDAAAVNLAFQTIGGYSADTAQLIAMQTAELAEQVGVAPARVFEDIAEASEDTYKYFKGDVKLLRNQAIEARRLGTNLKSVLKTTESLLNFEEGIEKELVASSFLAGQFNLSKARALAFDGRAVDAQKEILRQVQRYRKFADMDPITKQVVADATNMTVEELGKQLLMQEKLTHLSDEQKKLVSDAMDKGLDITNMNEDQLNKKVEELKQQEKIADELTKMENKFNAIAVTLGETFIPLLEDLVPIITAAFEPISWAAHGLKLFIDGLKQGKLGALALAAALAIVYRRTIANAIGSIFSGFGAMGPLGVALAGLAVAGLLSKISAAQGEKIGDGRIEAPSAGGGTMISTSEGGIFEASRNDQVAIGPNVLSTLDTVSKTTRGTSTLAAASPMFGNEIKQMVSEIKFLRKDLSEGKIRTNAFFDGSKVSALLATSTDESTRNVFSYGQRG